MPTATRPSTIAVFPLATFVAALALFVWLWSDYREYWLDDAFITFRYARNLAEGLGPVYNAGERVEGYTSLLWMLLSAVPFALASGANALWTIKLTALAASMWTLYRIFTFPSPEGPARRYWVVVLATQPIFILNSGDGMETPLFMVLMAECLVGFQRPPSRASGVVVGLATAAMILTRPEALPLLLALPALLLFAHRDDATQKTAVREWLVAFALAGLVPVVLHEAWRWGYYGHAFPNTYYAKATGDPLARLSSGMRDLGRFVGSNPWRPPVAIWFASAFACFATARLVSRARGASAPNPALVRWLGALWLMIGFRLSFDLWSGSDAMGRHRFLVPLLLPLVVLADEGLRMVLRGRSRAVIGCVVAAVFGMSLYFNITGHMNHEWAASHYRRGLANAHIKLGHWLNERYPAHTVVAVGDAGTVPFFSQMTTVDMWGLNDGTIAHMPGEYGLREGMPGYVFSRDPGVVVLWNRESFLEAPVGKILGGTELDVQVARHPAFGRDYRFVREFVFRKHSDELPGYYLDVFEKK